MMPNNCSRTLANASPQDAFNALQPAVQDDINVHRFVFAHRTYGLVGLLGNEYAHTLLRQSVRQMVDFELEHKRHNHPDNPIRVLLPQLLDQYKLVGKTPGKTDPGDAAVDASGTRRSTTAHRLGPPMRSRPHWPMGSIRKWSAKQFRWRRICSCCDKGADRWRTHGDSAGVHSSDATNAFRNMARNTDTKHAVSGLIVAAYHSASHAPFAGESYPLENIASCDQGDRCGRSAGRVRRRGQGQRSGPRCSRDSDLWREGLPGRGVFQTLIKYTISEDGRLHGEKYFHTVGEEYRTTRPAFRWRQITGPGPRHRQFVRLRPPGQARLPCRGLRRSVQPAGNYDVNHQPLVALKTGRACIQLSWLDNSPLQSCAAGNDAAG